MAALRGSSVLDFKYSLTFKKFRVLVSSANSFKDIVIEVGNNSKGNVVHYNIHNVVISTNIDQVNKLNNSYHLSLHETQNKWNPPIMELLRMVVCKLHNLQPLLQLILELEMKHHSTDESNVVASKVNNTSKELLLCQNITQEQESNN